MDRESWVYAIRRSADDLFLEEENILSMFMSTGHRFESILARDPNTIINMPQIYDTTRDIIYALKKLFELFSGSNAVFDYELEGETLRFNSYRIGFQRRINVLTNIEYSPRYILKFISGSFTNLPEKLIGAIGEKETSIVHWDNTDDNPEFMMRSVIADTNSLIERSIMDMGIGYLEEAEVETDSTKFKIVLTDDENEILIIEQKKDLNEWIGRLISLFKRFTSENQYLLPKTIDSKIDQEIVKEMSIVIMRRFLSYLVPPKKRGKVSLEKVSKFTNISEDLLINFFEKNLKDIYGKFGLKVSDSDRTISVEKLSKTRVITGFLMESNRYYDQLVAKLPSRKLSASDEQLELQNTSSYLGKIWGGYVFGTLVGESDHLFILYNDLLAELQGLNESRIILPRLKKEAADIKSKNSDKENEMYKINIQQFDNLKLQLEQRIEKLNENITKFISLIVQSYLILLKTISVPIKVLTPKKSQNFKSQVKFQFKTKGKSESNELIVIDDPKDWLILVFFSYILSQNEHVEIFLKSLGSELKEFYDGIEKTWDSLQLLTLESTEVEWSASIKVNQLFIKPSRRKNMVSKILNLR